ncbi:MAG: flagellar basal body rod protein FlgC [Firmicutes bacterium]|jgi:flagellar basal-body rod protein FlgC|nr:flagellar basal body rod protein FlgC [Bacillota bacterium]
MFRSFDISASGLTAERLRMDVIAGNVANANSTRSDRGGAYRRLMVVLQERSFGPSAPHERFSGAGVRVFRIAEDPSPLPLVYNPSHPDARPDGYVEMPNVNPVAEMVDLIAAARAYEANVTVFNASKEMAKRALDIGRA